MKNETSFNSTGWNPKLHHDEDRCQKTLIFPFRVGCPHNCYEYRQQHLGLSNKANNTMVGHRIAVSWYFGEPHRYNPNQAWNTQNGASTYDKGINFEAPEAFVRTFQMTADDLNASAVRTLAPLGLEFYVHPQKRMHLALSYFCCLLADEVPRAFEVIDKWIIETEFDFVLSFDNIEAWWKAPNSVTNIALVDEGSQRTLMQLNHDLNQRLEAANVPVIVPREDQMPFHSTVAGFQYSKQREHYDPKYKIAFKLPHIYDLVQTISERYKTNWTPTGGELFRVQHNPKRGIVAVDHTTRPLVMLST